MAKIDLSAPVVYLHRDEKYLPSDIAAHVNHTRPQVNFKDVTGIPKPLTLDNLDVLNSHGGRNVWLTSRDDVTKDPAWLGGVAPNKQGKTEGAVSSVIVTVAHDDKKTLDAFYLYFYSFNDGPSIFGTHLGNHVGDW